MSKLFDKLKKAASAVGEEINEFAERFDSSDPLIIIPYRGFANKELIYFKGRVLENENIFRGKTNSKIRNLINTFKRFETDEVKGANVKIECAGQTFFCKTNEEGYFDLEEKWNAPALTNENRWLSVRLELILPDLSPEESINAIGEIYLPSKNADYGIITDVDDTVLQTNVTSFFKLKMLYHTFLENADQRLPMEGMVELFQAFVKGGDGNRENPIFYLSHGPWNIYDLLSEFFETQKFPKGPILLRDFGINPAGEFAKHKITSVARILKKYPELPFILLGDTAESDADFYIEIANTFPNRIKAIYIRQTKDTKNAQRIKKLIEQETDANAVLIHSSADIRHHALENQILFK